MIKSNNVYHIDRIVFNFMDRCNMVCDFCYVPFDENGIGDLKLWLKIINKCKEWNPRRITFGGGDPFKIRKFPCLLKKLSLEDLFLQVDTNCLGLREHHLSIIKSAVKLISVPLEGPKSIHTKMRNNSYHFDLIINWINKFTKNKIGIKVNTVVTKLNINYLDELAKTLRKYSIKAWSLYQFWPIGPAKDNQKKYQVKTSDFFLSTSKIVKKYDFTFIDISDINERFRSYFIVSSKGRVYCINKNNRNEYVELGNIFEENIIKKWIQHGDPESIRARSERRISLV